MRSQADLTRNSFSSIPSNPSWVSSITRLSQEVAIYPRDAVIATRPASTFFRETRKEIPYKGFYAGEILLKSRNYLEEHTGN